MKDNKSKRITISLYKDTWKALKYLQIELEKPSLDATIKYLIKFYYERTKGV